MLISYRTLFNNRSSEFLHSRWVTHDIHSRKSEFSLQLRRISFFSGSPLSFSSAGEIINAGIGKVFVSTGYSPEVIFIASKKHDREWISQLPEIWTNINQKISPFIMSFSSISILVLKSQHKSYKLTMTPSWLDKINQNQHQQAGETNAAFHHL